SSVHLEVVDQNSWLKEMQIGRATFPEPLRDDLLAAGMRADLPVPPELSGHAAKWLQYIKDNQAAYLTITPRGIGSTVLSGDKNYRVQVRRRFMLLGQTLAGMQVWDVFRSIHATRNIK